MGLKNKLQTVHLKHTSLGLHFLPRKVNLIRNSTILSIVMPLYREQSFMLVAAWHSPWYSTYTARYREVECMRVAVEEIVYKHGVDIVFNGHVHGYERSSRVYNYSLDPCGPVHIMVGDGGNREKMPTTHADEPGNCPDPSSTPDAFMGGFCAFNFTSGLAAGKFCWDGQPIYSAVRESSFGHGILEEYDAAQATLHVADSSHGTSTSGDNI